MDFKNLQLIGQGERSKVYAHPTEADKVVKVTSSAAEKSVLRFLFANPIPCFVKVYSLETQGKNIIAVIEKLPNVEFVKFQANDGSVFFENAHMLVCDDFVSATRHYSAEENVRRIEAYIARRVNYLSVSEQVVREYYALLDCANRAGFWVPDVAWNLGRRADGTLCCYDATLLS